MAWTQDIFLAPRLEDVVRRLGLELMVVEQPAQLGAEGEAALRPIPLTEPLEGADAGLVRQLAELRPSLLIIDTSVSTLPWRRWLQVVKTSAATRRIPVVAFGPHVHEDVLEDAREAGADVVVSQGRFMRQLPRLIQEHATSSKKELLIRACQGSLAEKAARGIRYHDTGHYFEAHEELEAAWLESGEDEGYLYRAILQLSVAYYHVQKGNLRGARKMMLRIHQWLDPLPRTCRGIDVERLRTNAEALREALDTETDDVTIPDSLLRPIPRA